MVDNRVKNELDSFWLQHQQEVSRQPSVLRKGAYMKGQVKLLDTLLEKFRNTSDLNEWERASLVTMKVHRNQFNKQTNAFRLDKLTSTIIRGSAKATTGTLKTTGNLLSNTLNRAIRKILQRAPWPVKLVGHSARLLIALAGLILKNSGRLLDWVFGKVISDYKKTPPAQSPTSTTEQQSRQQDQTKRRGQRKTSTQQQQQKEQKPQNQTGQSVDPPAPSHPAEGPAKGPVDSPALRADQNNGAVNSQRYGHRERVFSTPSPNVKHGHRH